MLKAFPLAFAVVLATGVLAASAAFAQCDPYCDYTHDYGPYDFTWARPGLYGYARCGRGGECSPYLAYSYSGYPRGRITIRSRSRPLAVRRSD
jgi:hypothetical protein